MSEPLTALEIELTERLRLAVGYLENYEVQAIPFALHASCAADRCNEAIAKSDARRPPAPPAFRLPLKSDTEVAA